MKAPEKNMNWLRKLYMKLEGFGVNRPIATSTILAIALPTVAALLPDFGFRERLLAEYSISGFIILTAVIIVIPLMVTIMLHRRKDVSRKSILRRIHALLEKLNAPFERESISIIGHQPYKEKFYDYEMISAFDDYNRILSEAKSKWPDDFSTLNQLKNDKRIHPGDWIPESELNGVKVSLIHLKELLK